ncbi:hypothetical protein [Variovorax guangxiensis]|uniref:DNA injection protein n=1 Tax=Variovorax guangxiensis TaxID=1775474 RepID=A0A840G0M5_9BURK|nr:hypothetical protein [Variovorax guangxiensis]MBB4226024.1 hypothetical protein [Variovorax guangxiensis]
MGRQRIESRLERDRCEDGLGKQYCHVAAGVAAAGVAGSVISANGAKSAANAQSDAAQQASQVEMMMAAQTRADLAPWTQAGGASQSLLNRYLGIGGVGSSGVTSMGLATGLTPDQVRQQLLSRYTRQNATSSGPSGPRSLAEARATGQEAQFLLDINNRLNQQGGSNSSLWTTGNNNPAMGGVNSWDNSFGSNDGQGGGGSTIDEEGLNAAIAKYYEEQNAMNSAAEADPLYGSLLRPYRNGEEFSFTGKDLATDPGYQFGLNQGTQGIERGQASRGNFLSGAAMKELARFNEDYAGTKFNDAFNRAQSTWNTNLGAYNDNKNRIYNFLSGVSTLGQNAAAKVGASNQQVGNNVGGNLLAAGAAQSAGQVASSNALRSGINQAANAWNSVNPNTAVGWNNMLSQNGGGYSGYTGYVGNNDTLGNFITSNGYTG